MSMMRSSPCTCRCVCVSVQLSAEAGASRHAGLDRVSPPPQVARSAVVSSRLRVSESVLARPLSTSAHPVR